MFWIFKFKKPLLISCGISLWEGTGTSTSKLWLVQELDSGTILQNEETLCLSANCPSFHVADTESVGVSSDNPLCTPRASEQAAKDNLFTESITYSCPAMPSKRSRHVTHRALMGIVPLVKSQTWLPQSLFSAFCLMVRSPSTGTAWAQVLRVRHSTRQWQERKQSSSLNFRQFWPAPMSHVS